MTADFRKILARLLFALLVAVLVVAPPAAGPGSAQDSADRQEAPAEEPAKPEKPQAQLDAWKVEIDQIATAAGRDSLTDAALADLRARAEAIRAKATEVIDQTSPNVASIEARLKSLGPAPQGKEGDPAPTESDAVKQDREAQQKALAELQGFVKQASVVQLKADEVIRAIGDRRRDRFTKVLLEQQRSVVDPSLLREAGAALPSTWRAARFLITDWWSILTDQADRSARVVIAFVLIAVMVWARPVRRRLLAMTERDPSVVDPPLLRKSLAALSIVGVNVLSPLVGFVALYYAFDYFDLSPDRIDRTLIVLGFAAVVSTAMYALALAMLSPGKPTWRMIDINDAAAIRLRRLFVVLGITFGIGIFLAGLLDVLAAPLSLVVVVTGLFVLVDVVIIMIALRTVATSLAAGDEAVATPVTVTPITHPGPAVDERRASLLWRWLVPIAWIAAIVAGAANLVGFIALARFLVTQLIWAGMVLSALYILLAVVDEGLQALFARDTRLSTSLVRSMGFSRESVEQIGVVMSGAGRLVILALAAFLIVSPWGFDSTDLVAEAKAAFFGFKVGGLTVSLSSILIGIAVFLIAVAVTRGVQNWLDQRLLPRTRLDAGLKNSIRTAFGYVGFVLAAMLAFSSIGLSLENVAIVAGALSVGVGFGLQSIVNNFVSGLILLAERPIKAGDLVQIGTESGVVRKINVRSTEIETADRASLIVPNSSLISGNVKNWMHHDLTGRVLIDVGIDYGADPDKIKQVLLDCAKANRTILVFPAPSVFFTALTENAMMFRLVGTVANVSDAYGVESDLRFAIIRRLRDEGISIAHQQREVHVPELSDLAQVAARFVAGTTGTDRRGPDGAAASM